MDEVVKKWLEENGYSVDGYAILDSTGNTVENIDTPYGIEEGISQTYYNEIKERKNHLEEGGFDFKGQDYYKASESRGTEMSDFVEEKKLKDFEEGKTKTVPDFTDPTTLSAFNKLQEKNKKSGKEYYESPEAFISGQATIVEKPIIKVETTEISHKESSNICDSNILTSITFITVAVILFIYKKRILFIMKKAWSYILKIKIIVLFLFVGAIFGFIFKKYSTPLLIKAARYGEDFGHNGKILLEIEDSRNSLFFLGKLYDYNWLAFLVSFFSLLIINFLLKTTIIGSKILSFWESIKKK